MNSKQAIGVLLVIPDLTGGGAERVMSNIANAWATEKRSVSLLTLSGTENDHYFLHPDIKRIGLNVLQPLPSLPIWKRLSEIIRRIRALRKAIIASGHPIVISFLDNMNLLTIAAARGLPVKVIVSTRNEPNKAPCSLVKRVLRYFMYPRSDAVVVQTAKVRTSWAETFIPKEKCVVINNFIQEPNGNELNGNNIPLPEKFIVSAGRLKTLKQYDLLIKAFARVVKKYPDFSLVILGQGPELKKLTSLVEELHLSHKVFSPGFVENLKAVFKKAEFFVLTSAYDAFPNVLLESMSCGIPAISFDCPSGPGEIIRNGEDGILVPQNNIDELTASMMHLIENPQERAEMGKKASEVISRFSIEKILKQWDELIDNIVE